MKIYLFIIPFFFYLLSKNKKEGITNLENPENVYEELKNDFENILIQNENDIELNRLIYYSILFEIDEFSYSSFVETNYEEKKQMYTNDTLENKRFIKQKLKNKYEILCKNSSFQECLQLINKKYTDIETKDTLMLQQILFRKISLLLYLHSIYNSINPYNSLINLENMVNDFNTIDDFIKNYNKYIQKFNHEYKKSSNKYKKDYTFLKERIDTKNINDILNIFICKKYKDGNNIYGIIDNSIYKNCKKTNGCYDIYDLDITKNYICPNLYVNKNKNKNDNCCKQSYLMSLFKKNKYFFLLIIMTIFYLKN